MFVQYFALKSEANLPTSGRFIDPYDSSTYIPNLKETFPQFIDRLLTSREEKNLPLIPRKELETYAIASLAETCSNKDLTNFFYQKAEIPEFARVAALAKAILKQRLEGKEVSFKNRQERATKCSTCKFHKHKGGVKNFATNIIQKVAGLDAVDQSPLEKSLGNCGMCGCNLPTKIRFDLVAVLASITPEEIGQLITTYGPKAFDTCWILNESLKYPGIRRTLEAKLSRLGPKAQEALHQHLNPAPK